MADPLSTIRAIEPEHIAAQLDITHTLSCGDFHDAKTWYGITPPEHKFGIAIGVQPDETIDTEYGFVDVTIFDPLTVVAALDALGQENKAFVLFPDTPPRVMPPIHYYPDHPLIGRDFVSKDLREACREVTLECFKKLCPRIREECVVSAILMSITDKPMGKSGRTGFQRVVKKGMPLTVSMHVDDIKDMIARGVPCNTIEV